MISVDWGNQEETIIIWKFNGQWDARMFRRAVTKTYRMAEAKPYPVHGIVDMQRALAAPRDMITLIRQALRSGPTVKAGRWVIISESRLWPNLYAMAVRLYRLNTLDVRFVSSVQEAYDLVDEHMGL